MNLIVGDIVKPSLFKMDKLDDDKYPNGWSAKEKGRVLNSMVGIVEKIDVSGNPLYEPVFVVKWTEGNVNDHWGPYWTERELREAKYDTSIVLLLF